MADRTLFGYPVNWPHLDPEAEMVAFRVAFAAHRAGVDPVWYAKWLEPLVDPPPEARHIPPLEYAVREYLGQWRGCP